MSEITTKLRKTAREAYIKGLLGVEPVWRYTVNLPATLEYRRHGKALQDEAARVVADLNKYGCATTTVEALTGDPEMFGKLQTLARELESAKAEVVADQKAKLAQSGDLGNGKDQKHFVVTMLDHDRPVIEPDGLLARLMLNTQVKGVADAYYGLQTKISDINLWRNLPTGRQPTASQLWHRDLLTDHLMLKMFMYIEDVTDGGGPLAYVKGTHGKGRRDWKPSSYSFDGYNYRATNEEMDKSTTAAEHPSFAAPAGTIVFADTTGWHRGGFATTSSRFVLQALFQSNAALPDRALGVPIGLDLTKAPAELLFDRKTASV